MRVNQPVTHKAYEVPQDRPLMSVTDEKGRITYCNPSFVEVSGFSESELLGQAHNVVRHPDMPAEAFRDMWHTLQAGRPWSGLVKNRRKNGDHYWVQAHAMPLFDNGQIVGYFSLRTRAEVDAITQADEIYALLKQQEGLARPAWGLRRGALVRLNPATQVLSAIQGAIRVDTVAFLLSLTALGLAAFLGHASFGTSWLAVLVLAALATMLLSGYVFRPLRRLLHDVHFLAAGDLTVDLSRPETGVARDLQRALAQLALSVRTVVSDTRHEIHSLTGSITDIAAGNHELAGRTESQASSLEETAASMEQISGTVRQTNDAATRGAETAQKMVQIAQTSQEAVARVALAMDSIDASAQKMREIIHVIEGVAFQTNILALNAAVEAARAGEAGRGFSVVATEVRTLAQRTASAAQEIKHLISESIERVSTGNHETGAASTQMTHAVGAVKEVTGLLQEIATAAGQQHTGIGQIAEAVTQLDSITQQNAAMVQDLASSAKTLRGQVDHACHTMRLLRLSRAEQSLAQADAVSLRKRSRSTQISPAEGDQLGQPPNC